MNIVRIIARLNVGGPARHVALLDAGLRARGHRTLLVHGAVDTGEASFEDEARQTGIEIRRYGSLGRQVHAGSDVRAFVALLRTMFERQPDVIHTHTAKAGTLGRLAALVYNATRRRQRRALIVHTFHGHVFEGYFSPALNRAIRWTERLLAAGSDRIITISPRQRRDIVERFHVARGDKVVVVPLGLQLGRLLDLSASAPDNRHAWGLDASDLVAGFAGRMVGVKNLSFLLRAFAAARREVPELRLILAGDGPERQRLAELADRLGIANSVRFVGWVEDLPRFYASLDLFVLSSVNEGTPVAVIEAMAAARPIVATDVGGVADVVEDRVSGLLVGPNDVDAFTAAIVSLANSPDTRMAMGRAGRQAVAARYSDSRLVSDIEQLYVEALREKRQ